MLVDPEVLILVREGFSLGEIEAHTGLCRERSDAMFMRALAEIDREARRQRYIENCRRWNSRRKLAGSQRDARSS
jgi:hypothetical protein